MKKKEGKKKRRASNAEAFISEWFRASKRWKLLKSLGRGEKNCFIDSSLFFLIVNNTKEREKKKKREREECTRVRNLKGKIKKKNWCPGCLNSFPSFILVQTGQMEYRKSKYEQSISAKGWEKGKVFFLSPPFLSNFKGFDPHETSSRAYFTFTFANAWINIQCVRYSVIYSRYIVNIARISRKKISNNDFKEQWL